MKKYEYLSELEKRLSALPADARRDALNYYEEYFDAAGPDNEDATAAELGDPAEAARKILEGEGLTLDAAEQKYLENDESDFWSDLTDWQREQLGISEEELDSEMEKIALADKYQSIYAEMNQKEYEAYNFNGEAYEALLSEHKYSVNEKVWDRVDFGSVTLDN